MRLGKPYLSFAPGIDPASPLTNPAPYSMQTQLRRSLATEASQGNYQAQIQALSAGTNQQLGTRSRAALYAQITQQLAALQQHLALPIGSGPAPAASSSATPGSDTTLAQISGGLLQSNHGQYTVTLNGVKLGFSANQKASDVVDEINGSEAGVQASFNASNHTFTLTSPDNPTPSADVAPSNAGPTSAGDLVDALNAQSTGATATGPENPQPLAPWLAGTSPLSGTDQNGSFFRSATVTAPNQAVSSQNPATVQALGGLGAALNNVVSLLQTAVSASGTGTPDPLVNDLNDALSGLIRPSGGQGLQTLGDVGFSLHNGTVSFDAQTFSRVAASQPTALENFLGRFLNGPLQTLVNSGIQAIADQQALMPLDQSLATQDVHVRGEIARLRFQQQSLLFEQTGFERHQAALKSQHAELSALHKRLDAPDQPPQKPTADQASRAVPPTPPVTPVTPPSPDQGLGAAPGLLSFGLSR